MKTQERQSQSEAVRLQTVIELLHISARKLATLLKYKSHGTVYHVLEGRNNLSPGMISKIVKKFPNVSYQYLKEGKGEPLLTRESEILAQQNILGLSKPIQDNLEKAVNQNHDPLTYNVAQQLQLIIDNGMKANRLLEALLEENIEMKKLLVDKY